MTARKPQDIQTSSVIHIHFGKMAFKILASFVSVLAALQVANG